MLPRAISPVPPLPHPFLARPRLSMPAVESTTSVKLFCAPAGTGKTVLLLECLQQLPGDVQVVWIPSLAALQDSEELIDSLCHALEIPAGHRQETLMHMLGQQESPIHLILDDYCRIEQPLIDDLLLQLITGSSRQITWWISSRRPLHCRFTRLELDGRVFAYKTPSCLSFNQDEMDALAKLVGVTYTPEQHLQTMHATGGWCIAVRAALASPANGQHTLHHYLQNELFRTLNESDALLWQLCAHLGQFSAALVSYIMEIPVQDVQAAISNLTSSGAFIEPAYQPKNTYTVYPPLSEHVRKHHTDGAASWHLKASQWHASLNHWQLAVEHALRAGHDEEALSMVQKVTDEESMSGDNVAVLMQLRDKVPRDILYFTPRLTALISSAQIFAGQLDDARASMTHFAKFLPDPVPSTHQSILAQWQAFQGWIDHLEGRKTSAIDHLQCALAGLSGEHWEIALTCYSAQTQQALLAGNLSRARSLNRAALQLARQHESILLEAYLELDHAQLLEHRASLGAAASLLERSIQLLYENHALQSPVLGRLYMRLGQVQVRMGNWKDAQHNLGTGLREALHWGDHRALYGHCGLAFIALSQNQPEQAFAHLRDAERSMQKNHIPEAVYRPYLLFASSVFYVHQDKTSTAEQTLNEILQYFTQHPGLVPPPASFELLPRCHLYLAICNMQQQRLHQAKNRLEELRTYAQQHELSTLAAEASCLLKLCLYQEHSAYIDGLDHPVFDECLTLGLSGFAQELLRLFYPETAENAHTVSSSHMLSTREVEVLKLVAMGLANKQIADKMHISLHTVKTHLQRIYKKIEVSRRTQAIAKAKQMGII